MSHTLFVGDVHGCALELGLLLDEAKPERVVLLGDLFAKGPDPVGVWEIIQAFNADSVLGNHDAAVLQRWRGSPDSPLPEAAFAWLDARPLFLRGEGPAGPWLAVHAGIDPDAGVEGTTREMALNLRRLPWEGQERPFWWQRYRGPALVLYGHDARRGLQDHRPYSLGLDTGCVYGGALSGFLLEEGRFLRVPARAVYLDPLASPTPR